MKFVEVTVDGKKYTLYKNSNDDWVVTNRAPKTVGEYPVTVTITQDNGKVIVLNGDDPNLQDMLTLFVTQGVTISGKRMLDYYPYIIKIIEDFQALMFAEGFEIDFATSEFDFAINDAYLTTMSESRVSEWEKALGITPLSTDTIQQRRDVIISKFRGGSKLNTESISSIVKAFTNGDAISSFKDGVLKVEVRPPLENKEFKFSDVENALRIRIPAHIQLNVVRDYATWDDVKSNYASWNSVYSLNNWNELKAYLPPQG